jgi:hypothetical protein
MKKIIYVLIVLVCFSFLFSSCSKSKENIKFVNDNGKEEKIEIIRFDKALFAKPLPNLEVFLKNLQKKYPYMFQTTLDNPQYLNIIEQFVMDNNMQNVQGIVEKQYPDLNFLQNDLTSAFARLKKEYPKTQLPKNIYTLLFGPADFSYAYENKIVVTKDFSAISLDMYTMHQLKNNEYYKQIPRYMIPTLSSRYIAPDFMRVYLREMTFKSIPLKQMQADCTLLDYIIEDGKYSYLVHSLLPLYKDNEVLDYTEQQMSWCNTNEKNIWGFIIQNNLLFEKDRTKYMSLTSDGPESKGLSGSPARVGNYIGYNIVSDFMKQTKISIDSLMKISDATIILKQSHYKPKKR